MSTHNTDTASTDFLENEKLFDFIVIGGGTSGLVVASRLTENHEIRVLVIEAGANLLDDPKITIPGLALSTLGDPLFDWNIMSPPQEHLNGRKIAQPRGRTLGGSSAINMGMVIYPSKVTFDAWEQLGNPGWDWKSMSGYFQKFQTFTPPHPDILKQLDLGHLQKENHGTDGPIQVSFGEDGYTSFNRAWPQIFENLNFHLIGDPISGTSTGAFNNPGSINPNTGTRSHAGSAYFNSEVAKRPNLFVLTEALVEKIIVEKLIDGNPVAQGVQVVTADKTRRNIFAREEVIIAAGAIKSPQLLELSGIGNRQLLEYYGIEVLVESEFVGENLQDHGLVPASWEVADGNLSLDHLRNPEMAALVSTFYEDNRSGPLAVCATSSSFVPLVHTEELKGLLDKYLGIQANEDLKVHQFKLLRQILLTPGEATGQYTMAAFQISPKNGPQLKNIFNGDAPEYYISIISGLNYPFSRGSVHIQGTDANDQPFYDPGILSHPLDLEIHSRHVQWLETLATTEPLASLLKKNGRRIHSFKGPECSIEEVMEATRDTILSNYHVIGTCAMMPKEIGGVVDSELKVYGMMNLRVVDASIFPLLPRGNIQTSVYAVAEKAADIIKIDFLAKQERKLRLKHADVLAGRDRSISVSLDLSS